MLDATQTRGRLVEDVRALVLTDAGSRALQKEPTDMGALAVEMVDSFSVQAEAAGVELRSDIANNLPSVVVDPARIRGVIGNLLSNAIRHTPAGGSGTFGVSASGTEVAT